MFPNLDSRGQSSDHVDKVISATSSLHTENRKEPAVQSVNLALVTVNGEKQDHSDIWIKKESVDPHRAGNNRK
jgi:hypothetical protein